MVGIEPTTRAGVRVSLLYLLSYIHLVSVTFPTSYFHGSDLSVLGCLNPRVSFRLDAPTAFASSVLLGLTPLLHPTRHPKPRLTLQQVLQLSLE
jgi:hypothetical protein